MQQNIYFSIKHKEMEEHFIECANNVISKIFEEYDVPAMKKYFGEYYAKIQVTLTSSFLQIIFVYKKSCYILFYFRSIRILSCNQIIVFLYRILVGWFESLTSYKSWYT